jgi:acyl carrier protein
MVGWRVLSAPLERDDVLENAGLARGSPLGRLGIGLSLMESVRSEIKQILVDVLELNVRPDEIGDEDPLFDGMLGMNSIACIEILTEIEDHFHIEIDDSDIAADLFASVRTLADSVEKFLAKQG